MKQIRLFLIMIFVMVVSISVYSQKQKKKSSVYNPYEIVDTRIDNMGYWRKVAAKGLVSVAPNVKVPEAVFTGTRIRSTSVVRDDSPDKPVTTENSTQSENSVFVDPTDTDHALQSNNSTQNPVGNLYGANYFWTYDFGETWGGSVQGAGGANSGDPATAISLTGRQYVGFIHSNGGQGVAYSSNGGTSWTSVLCGPPPGGWDILDKNHLWIDNSTTSPYAGNVYSAWTAFGNANANDIEIVRSNNNGVSYSTPVNISSAVNAGSHCQGVNVTSGPNGEVYVVWSIYDSWPSDEKALGFAKSLDGGQTWQTATRIINNTKGIRNSGTGKNMRVNSFPSMTCDISGGSYNGNIYVTWTNKGEPGINTGSGSQVWMIKSSNQGATWSTPIKINQDPITNNKQHYFGWITCDPETGTLSVIWYDDRNTSSSQVETWCANSFDGGDTWEEFKVSDVAQTPTPIPGLAGSYYGDYIGISARGSKVYPVWTDNRLGHAMTFCSPYETNNLARPADLSAQVTFETGQVALIWSFEEVPGFQNFNIYRDNVLVGTTSDTTYIDMLPTYGIFKYKVTAQHLEGESSPVAATVQWGDAHINVNPDQLTVNLPPNQTQVEYITVTNVGELPLVFSVSSAVNTDKGPKSYCSAGGGCDEFISNVTVGTINNDSDCGQYQDFTDLSTDMNKGESYPITIENGNPYSSDQCGIWIDWNNNESFTDDAPVSVSGTPGNGPYSANIIPPMTAVSGPVRMRIRITWTGSVDPCGTTTYGEVEDYTINVSGWLMVGAVTDTIAPGANMQIPVNFNTEDILEGTYTGSVNFSSNDPNASLVSVPITLNVANSFPLAISATAVPSVICSGQSSQLNAGATGGSGTYTYTWTSNPAGFTSNVANPVVNPTVTTIYYIEVTDGINTATDDVTVTVETTPSQPGTPFGDSEVCQNTYMTTYGTAGAVGGTSYNWQILPAEAGTISGMGMNADVVWTPGFTGTASITVIALNTCGQGAPSNPLVVNVNILPEVDLGEDFDMCANETILLDAGNPGSQYLWSTGATTQTITMDTTGFGLGNMEVWVQVTNQFQCSTTDMINILFLDCTGIGEGAERTLLSVQPNPSNGNFEITVRSETPETYALKIYNSFGNQVFADIIAAQSTSISQSLNLMNLANGVYYMTLTGNNNKLTKKLIIRK